MAKYRNNLPLDQRKFFLTDGGMETDFIFHHGIDIPHFATFELLKDPAMEQKIEDYFIQYFDIAKKYNAGFILGGLTWRANNDWGGKFGYTTPEAVDQINKKVIGVFENMRRRHETADMPIIISGSLGPRGDGNDPGNLMTITQAQHYHSSQIRSFYESGADIVSALTMTNVDETIGIVLAAKEMAMPISVSFTVETDGKLPTCETIKDAIEKVDIATEDYAEYFMINCAHPTHFANILRGDENYLNRISGIRANASRCSHAELDEASELDDGNPHEFGLEYKEILDHSSHIKIIGGCCGTDHRHVEQAIKACS